MPEGFRTRFTNAVKRSLSLEGLVAAIIGGAVWAIAAGVLSQFTEFSLVPTLLIGVGCGLLAAAVFLWRFVLPARRKNQRQSLERDTVLQHSAREHLRELADEGELWVGAGLAPTFSRRRAEWQRKVDAFLIDAFGKDKANEVMTRTSVRGQILHLRELAREDDLPIRSSYRGS